MLACLPTSQRADFLFDADGVFPELLLEVIASHERRVAGSASAVGSAGSHGSSRSEPHRSRGRQSVVYTRDPADTTCYGQVDWFAAMPRRLAHAYFNLSRAPCGWTDSAAGHATARSPLIARRCPLLNELLHVQWARSHGVGVAGVYAARRQRACATRRVCNRANPRPGTCRPGRTNPCGCPSRDM